MTILIRKYYTSGKTSSFHKVSDVCKPFKPRFGMIMHDILCGDFEEMVLIDAKVSKDDKITMSKAGNPVIDGQEYEYKKIVNERYYYFGQFGKEEVTEAIKEALQ